ncbi:MAG: hypothetical protein ACRDO8_11780 [Nocardioidaceae bacterium]
MFPELQYAQMLITLVRGRAERARRSGRSELGASAIEWAIISAIVVTLAVIVAKKIKDVVTDRTNQIGNENGGA